MFDNQLEQELNGLSPEERDAVLKILQEYSIGDNSSTFNQLLFEDYEEIPADINTFMHNRKYLGNALYDAEGKFTIFGCTECQSRSE